MSDLVLPIGSTFAGDFVVEGALGSGGMGAVHRVLQRSTEKARALKVMRPALVADVDMRRRFIQEARVSGRIDSDHIVEVLTAGVDEKTHLPFIVMELLDGVDLGARVKRDGPLALEEARVVLEQAFHGVAAAHAAGIVHRDIKPENVFLASSRRVDVRFTVKLLDFGIAKVVKEATNRTTAAIGSPLWMSPEQTMKGPITPGADVWSLGLLTFYILIGKPFWREASTAEMSFAAMVRELLLDPIPNARDRARDLGKADALPPRFEDWFERSVTRDVTKRFPEGKAQWTALESILGDTRRTSAPSIAISSGVSSSERSRLASTLEPDEAFSNTATSPGIGPPPLVSAATSPRSSIATRAGTWPAPLASLGAVTSDTPQRFEDLCRSAALAAAILRYAVAVALARLASEPAHRLNANLTRSIREAGRWSERDWCAFARALVAELALVDAPLAKLLAFVTREPATIATQLEEVLQSGSDAAPPVVLLEQLLDEASELLALELRLLTSIGTSGEPRAFLIDHERGLSLDPWLPRIDGRLALPDAPHMPGEPWRAYDPLRGEHHHAPAFDEALRALARIEAGQSALRLAPPIIGRDAALRTVERALEEARAGAVRVAILHGPVGVGRTRMLEAAATRGAERGFTVFTTACSRERRGALRCFEGLFTGHDHLLETLQRAQAAIHISSAEGVGAHVESIEAALLQAGEERPLLLVIDELQWADEATLGLIALLLERTALALPTRFAVVASVRSESTSSARLGMLLARSEARIDLPPLSDADARALVQSVAPLAREVEDVIVEGAAGVPAFLLQSLSTWHEEGALVWKDGTLVAATSDFASRTSPAFADLVRARLASFFGLYTPALRAAEITLSVIAIAERIPRERLDAVMSRLGVDSSLLDATIDALADASLLVVGGSRGDHSFGQPLLRRAALDVFEARPWFSRAHRVFLDVVALDTRAKEEASVLASGYEALGIYPEARRWLEVAANEALQNGLFEEASTLSERLFALAPDPNARALAGVLSADALHRGGDAAAALRRFEQIDGSGVTDRAVSVRGRILGVALGTSEDDARLIADADATRSPLLSIEARLALATKRRGSPALSLLDAVHTGIARVAFEANADLRYRLRSLELELLYEVRASSAAWRNAAMLAASAAKEAGALWAELDVQADLAVLEADAGNPDEAIVILHDVAERARAAGFGTIRRNALSNIAVCHRRAGRWKETAEAARTAANVAREAGSRRQLAAALSTMASAFVELGELREALVAFDDSIAIQRTLGAARIVTALLRRGELRRRLGDANGARSDIRDALTRAEQAGALADVATARAWLTLDSARTEPSQRAILSTLLEQHRLDLERTQEGRAVLAGIRDFLAQS